MASPRPDTSVPPSEIARSVKVVPYRKPLTSLMPVGYRAARPAVAWERLWLATQRRPWRSLALVPAGPGVPPDFTLDVAAELVRTGSMHLGVPIRIADATKVSLSDLVPFMNQISSVISAGDMVMLALAPVNTNATTVSLAQAADGALLCVPLRYVKSSEARQTVQEIGPQEFVGSVAFHV